jgi:hypothetical protein
MVFVLLFVCLLGTGAWLNRMLLEDRHQRAMRLPSGSYRNFAISEAGEPDISRMNYRPREYVKIVRQELFDK